MVQIKYNPAWKKYENKIHTANGEEARNAADAFQEIREQEMKNDPTARRWEEERRQEVNNNKPEWKKQQIREEKSKEEQIIKELQNGGVMSGGLRPARGLMVVKKVDPENKVGEIYLPDATEYESNTAQVIRVGLPQVSMGTEIKSPAEEGETVLFRKGAGLNIKINGEQHLIIRFDEVFGVVEE